MAIGIISPRNKTVRLTDDDSAVLKHRLVRLSGVVDAASLANVTINQDVVEAMGFMPDGFADLVFADPPYNINKGFDGRHFREMSLSDYEEYLESWVPLAVSKLRDGGSMYVCGDWKSSAPVQRVLSKYLTVRNRVTFEREKGRGAKRNWKNCSEDLWFATKGDGYYFDVEPVKLKRRVLAPYREEGKPKDWQSEESGKFRMTHPSNVWTDITVPFWSMPENTQHPTQKAEKLLAKVILASSKPGDVVFDPFLGSGTTSVVAKKLGRVYCGVDVSEEYCLTAEKRLANAQPGGPIQGYSDGVFVERNS